MGFLCHFGTCLQCFSTQFTKIYYANRVCCKQTHQITAWPCIHIITVFYCISFEELLLIRLGVDTPLTIAVSVSFFFWQELRLFRCRTISLQPQHTGDLSGAHSNKHRIGRGRLSERRTVDKRDSGTVHTTWINMEAIKAASKLCMHVFVMHHILEHGSQMYGLKYNAMWDHNIRHKMNMTFFICNFNAQKKVWELCICNRKSPPILL